MKIVVIEHISGAKEPSKVLATVGSHEDAIVVAQALATVRRLRDVTVMAHREHKGRYAYPVACFSCGLDFEGRCYDSRWPRDVQEMPARALAAQKVWEAGEKMSKLRGKIIAAMPEGRFEKLMQDEGFRGLFCGPKANLAAAEARANTLGLPFRDAREAQAV